MMHSSPIRAPSRTCARCHTDEPSPICAVGSTSAEPRILEATVPSRRKNRAERMVRPKPIHDLERRCGPKVPSFHGHCGDTPRAERVWRPTSTDDAPRVARPLLAKSFERVNDDHARPKRVESCFPPVTLVVVQERSERVRAQSGEHHVPPLTVCLLYTS